MAKQSNTGIYQLPNGNWAYRFTQTINGKRHNHKSVKDEKTNNHSGGSHLPKSIKSIATRAGAGKPIPPSASKTAFGEITFPQSLERVSLIQLALRKSTITYQNCITQMDALTGMLRVF